MFESGCLAIPNKGVLTLPTGMQWQLSNLVDQKALYASRFITHSVSQCCSVEGNYLVLSDHSWALTRSGYTLILSPKHIFLCASLLDLRAVQRDNGTTCGVGAVVSQETYHTPTAPLLSEAAAALLSTEGKTRCSVCSRCLNVQSHHPLKRVNNENRRRGAGDDG